MAVGQAKTIPDKYQAKVGRLQEADRFYAKADGYFAFFDYEFTGRELRNMLKSMTTAVVVKANSAGVISDLAALSTPTLPGYGMVYFSVATAASNASMRLPVPEAGNMLVLDGRGCALSVSIVILASNTDLCGGSGIAGVTLLGLNGRDLSAIALAMSVDTSGFPTGTLKCLTAGTWSVVARDDVEMFKEYPSA